VELRGDARSPLAAKAAVPAAAFAAKGSRSSKRASLQVSEHPTACRSSYVQRCVVSIGYRCLSHRPVRTFRDTPPFHRHSTSNDLFSDGAQVRAAAAPKSTKSTVGKPPAAATKPVTVDLTKPVGPIAKAEKPLKIVFVSTEVAPWSKTGGLGDVVGSLPEELVKRGHKVRATLRFRPVALSPSALSHPSASSRFHPPATHERSRDRPSASWAENGPSDMRNGAFKDGEHVWCRSFVPSAHSWHVLLGGGALG
jgi:hypothetical protein